MQLVRRFRISSLFCALALLLCALISRPYAEMGIADDGPYILTARGLATTGHLAYNGWVSAMLGWQLYLGAVLIKLFGFSFTAVRMSGLLISMALAFVLQPTLVRAGLTERNATIGTLAFVLSPLYLTLSVTFMSDVPGSSPSLSASTAASAVWNPPTTVPRLDGYVSPSSPTPSAAHPARRHGWESL